MKRIFGTLVLAALVGLTNAQNSQDQQKVISAMDAIGYSADNSEIYKIDILKLIYANNSLLYVGCDTLQSACIVKKAIIHFNGKGSLVEIYMVSNFLKTLNDPIYIEYVSYTDNKSMVHELLQGNSKDEEIMKKLTIFLRKAPLTD